jgi:Ion channel
LRFLERRIGSATVAAICLLLIHDTINISTLSSTWPARILTRPSLVALVIFGVIHAVSDGFTYSQAYYVTLASTVASLVVTTTLMIDYFRTSNFTKSGSGLTRKQRSLVIIVMVLLSYLGFGALIYCFMMEIHFLDALYFVVCSTLTIGFGDITPSNTGSQIFSIIYNTFGILNTGLAIAIARETVVEAFQQSYRNRRHALAARRKQHRHIHAKHHASKHGLWLAAHHINLSLSSIPQTPQIDPTEDGYKTPNRQEQPPREGSPTPSLREKQAGREELVPEPDHVEKLQEMSGGENNPTMEAAPKAESSKRTPFERTDTMLSAKSGRSRAITFDSVTPSKTADRSNDVRSTEGSQTVGEIVDAEHEEAQEQMKQVDDHLVAGFGDEDAEYIKFRQEIIKEERKEFKAKVRLLHIYHSFVNTPLHSSWSRGDFSWFSGSLVASFLCCLNSGLMGSPCIFVCSAIINSEGSPVNLPFS